MPLGKQVPSQWIQILLVAKSLKIKILKIDPANKPERKIRQLPLKIKFVFVSSLFLLLFRMRSVSNTPFLLQKQKKQSGDRYRIPMIAFLSHPHSYASIN